LQDVTFEVPTGTVTALIGPNGAGKTTLFNCVNRLQNPDSGRILLDDIDVTNASPAKLASLGVARTFQHSALFASLSVTDNIRIGRDLAHRSGRINRAPTIQETLQLLELDHLSSSSVESLPLGTKKRIEIARALASAPQMLMLDEPAGGLTHQEVDELRLLLTRLRCEAGLTILLVEHHMNMVMTMSDRIVVLNSGKVISEGSPEEVRVDPRVISAYLGS